jgi:hypothetical protein
MCHLSKWRFSPASESKQIERNRAPNQSINVNFCLIFSQFSLNDKINFNYYYSGNQYSLNVTK